MGARLAAILFGTTLTAAAMAQSVTFTLSSPQNGQTVSPGAVIAWTIQFTDSLDNQGVALACVDLTQDAANPVKFDIPPATAPVPAGMTNFARPAGITNPGDVVVANGFYGVQRGTAGQKNLIQIGGMQNTFGIAQSSGAGIAESSNVVANIGQSGGQILASGSFVAPATVGVYTFRLQNGLANTLVQRNNAPQISPVTPAATSVVGASISFTVSTAPPCLRGDANCDNAVNNFDIDYFVDALLSGGDSTAYLARGGTQACFDLRNCWGDFDASSTLNNFDIDGFVSCILSSPPPGQACQ